MNTKFQAQIKNTLGLDISVDCISRLRVLTRQYVKIVELSTKIVKRKKKVSYSLYLDKYNTIKDKAEAIGVTIDAPLRSPTLVMAEMIYILRNNGIADNDDINSIFIDMGIRISGKDIKHPNEAIIAEAGNTIGIEDPELDMTPEELYNKKLDEGLSIEETEKYLADIYLPL